MRPIAVDQGSGSVLLISPIKGVMEPTAKSPKLGPGQAASAVTLDGSGDIGRLYGAKTAPHMYIIDPQGTLVYMGGIDSITSADPSDIERTTQYISAALDEILAGKR